MELCVKFPEEAEQDPVAASVVASVGRALPDTAAAQLIEMREHSASIDSMHEAIARVTKVKAKFCALPLSPWVVLEPLANWPLCTQSGANSTLPAQSLLRS